MGPRSPALWTWAVLASLTGWLVGCSGASEEGLYRGGGGQGAAAGGGAAGAPHAGAGGASGAGAGGGTEDAGGSGGVPDATAPDTGAEEAGVPDAEAPDASAEAGIGCGAASCSAQGQQCCRGDNRPATCTAVGADCPCEGLLCGSRTLRCDDHEDCAGQRCCAERDLTSMAVNRTVCLPACVSDTPVGVNRRPVCRLSGPPCARGRCVAEPGLGPGLGTCN